MHVAVDQNQRVNRFERSDTGSVLAPNCDNDGSHSHSIDTPENLNDSDDITSVNGTSSIHDVPVPAVSNLREPLVPSTSSILDAPIIPKLPSPIKPMLSKRTKAVPALIPIGAVHQSTNKPTGTSKYISQFLRNLEQGKHHTVSPKSININQSMSQSFCSDADFGRLHYSDSDSDD